MRGRIVEIVRRVLRRSAADDVGGLATQLAWSFLLALFPFGIFAAALSAFVAGALGLTDPTDNILNALGDNLPANLAALIRPELQHVIQKAQPGLVSVGAVGALWAATGGTMTLTKAMNRAYDVPETRGFVSRYAQGVALTLLVTIGLITSFAAIVGGTLITQDLGARLGLGAEGWATVSVLRWPAVFIVLVVAVTILFRLAPNVAAPWRWTALGAGVFAIGWLAATYGFAFYVANFGRYGATYGSLGGVVVLMIWFYASSLLLAIAAEIVAALTAVLTPEHLARRHDEIEQELAARPAAEAGPPDGAGQAGDARASDAGGAEGST